VLIKLLYGGSPLIDDPTPMVVAEVSALDLIPLETGVVIHQFGILLIRGSTGLFDRLTRDRPVFGGVVTLYVLYHNFRLGLEVLSLL
jgi:hypothetical protein